jgi:hypothetical protein
MRRRTLLTLALLCAIITPAILWAQTKNKTVRRAQPPKFNKTDGPFYADAFKEGLVGARPANLGQPVVAAAGAATGSAPAAGSGTGGVAGSGWKAIISAASLEDEIKSLKLKVDGDVSTPSDYAGKGYKVARRDFSMLAMLFGIVGEYDGDVRWKKEAPAARDVIARTAANSKVGTSQVFAEAKLRKQELQDLLSGSNPYTGKTAEAKAAWGNVCDRAPLMQHIETIYEPKLKPMLADKGQFTANIATIQHDAEIIGAVSEVLSKNGMADADSDEYKAFCASMRKACQEIADACKTKNYEQAAAASSTIGKACRECHENYRS